MEYKEAMFGLKTKLNISLEKPAELVSTFLISVNRWKNRKYKSIKLSKTLLFKSFKENRIETKK